MTRSWMRRRAVWVSLAGAVVALALAAGAIAAATPFVTGLAAPWGIGTGPGGRILVVEAGTASILEVRKGGTTVLGSGLGEFVTDVAGVGRGNVAYLADGSLHRLLPNGTHEPIADLAFYEAANNPDAGNTYGVIASTIPAGCDLDPALVEALVETPGMVDSNPYGLAAPSGDMYYVADAGGNDILRVDSRGRISVVAVLPPVPKTLTEESIDAFNQQIEDEGLPLPPIPACLAGATFNADPVPTSVVVGRDGALYVGGLTGVPEDPGTGVVFRVDPRTGGVSTWLDGLTSVVDIAFAPDGSLIVAELFGFDPSAPGPPGVVKRVPTSRVGGALAPGAPVVIATGGPAGFMMPLGVVVDARGTVYATGGPLFGGESGTETGGVWTLG